MNYYEHHIGDYAQATSHLTFLEDAAYSRLIRKYYADEKPLPADKKSVQRLVGARSKEEREAVDSILDEFFVLMDDGWHNKRCDAEVERYNSKKNKARQSAEARWSAQRTQCERIADEMPADCEGNANASETHGERNALQSPVTSHQTPIPPKPPRAPRSASPAFDAFWLAYPRKAAKPKALAAWAKVNPDDQTIAAIMAGLQSAKALPDWNRDNGQFIPHPATWLNQRRWEDSAPQPIEQVHPMQLPKGHPTRVAYETRGI